MNLYAYSNDLSVKELGNCDIDRAMEALESKYHAGMQKFDLGEECLEKTFFGLSRDKHDFLEITCNGKDAVAFDSDRLCYDSFFAKYFSGKIHLRFSVSRTEAITVIENYFRLSRSEFEKTYESHYIR